MLSQEFSLPDVLTLCDALLTDESRTSLLINICFSLHRCHISTSVSASLATALSLYLSLSLSLSLSSLGSSVPGTQGEPRRVTFRALQPGETVTVPPCTGLIRVPSYIQSDARSHGSQAEWTPACALETTTELAASNRRISPSQEAGLHQCVQGGRIRPAHGGLQQPRRETR